MHYRHTVVYRVRGIVLPEGTERILVDRPDEELRAWLTTAVDTYCAEGDQRDTVANMLLDGAFGADNPQPWQDRLVQGVTQMQAQRRNRFSNGPFVVIAKTGPLSSYTPSVEREEQPFILCFDGSDTKAIRSATTATITSLIMALVVGVDHFSGLDRVSDFVMSYRDDGKAIFSYTASVGSATAYVSSPLDDETGGAIDGLYATIVNDPDAQRVVSIMLASLEHDDDRLRAFLSAYTALEVFIRKMVRSRAVLIDAFAWVNQALCASDYPADRDVFRDLNQARNAYLHSQGISEASFPLEDTRRLLRKYLRLYLQTENAREKIKRVQDQDQRPQTPQEAVNRLRAEGSRAIKIFQTLAERLKGSDPSLAKLAIDADTELGKVMDETYRFE